MRLLVLAITASLLSGCFVFDELDKGEAIMNAHRPESEKKAEEAEATAAARAKAKDGKPVTSASLSHEWWSKAKSLSRAPEDSDDPGRMVRCTRGKSSTFTRRSDCLAKGGTPSKP